MTDLKRPFRWGRGFARYDDGWIVLDEVEQYAVEASEDQVFALAGVREPADALAFVARYGMLQSAPTDARPLRERFSQWQHVASQMTETIGLVIDLREVQRGDEQAGRSLRQHYDRVAAASSFFGPLADDDEVSLEDIADLITSTIEPYRFGARSVLVPIHDGESWGWRFVVGANNLLSAIYQDLAELLVAGREMRLCAECGRPFPVTDPRRLFHSESCAYRVRRRRMLEKRKRESAGAVDAGTAEP